LRNKKKTRESSLDYQSILEDKNQFEYEEGKPRNPFINASAIVPKLMGIAVYSPGLNEHGNSLVGTKALELFTDKTLKSIF
jgi:glutaminase